MHGTLLCGFGITGATSDTSLWFVHRIQIGISEVDEEPADPLRHRTQEFLALVRGRRFRVSGSGVVSDLRPLTRRPRPTIAQSRNSKFPRPAGPRLR